jgi:2-oxoglutarate ferredoxin oxidoreductase subunit gamma
MLCHRGDRAVSTPDPLEIVIAGQAGQGAVFAGILLAEAVLSSGKFAVQTSKTGAAVRSGASEAHVLISETWVDYPYVENPSALIALSQESARRYRAAVRPDTIVIFDPEVVSWCPDVPVRQLRVSASKAAETSPEAPNENMFLLGAFAQATGIVTVQKLVNALRLCLQPQSAAEAALLLGAECASKSRGI